MSKKTLIIGASLNPIRYSFKAANLLFEKGHSIELLGSKEGILLSSKIFNYKSAPNFNDIDTVTMYIGPAHQDSYFEYIINFIRPQRVIFNPGTENPKFYQKLTENGIQYLEACTLVLLQTNQY